MTFGGLPTRWEPEGTARGLGLVLPGRAYSPAAEHGLDAVWLTPLLVHAEQAAAIEANPGRQLLVGGLADGLCDTDVAARLASAGCEVLELPGADHLLTVDDVVRTAQQHVEVARAVNAFLGA